MSTHKTGTLQFNPETNRYGILNSDLWIDTGLHCGEMFEIFFNNEWIVDRIEYSDDWYLVYSKLKGNDLNRLKVRY